MAETNNIIIDYLPIDVEFVDGRLFAFVVQNSSGLILDFVITENPPSQESLKNFFRN